MPKWRQKQSFVASAASSLCIVTTNVTLHIVEHSWTVVVYLFCKKNKKIGHFWRPWCQNDDGNTLPLHSELSHYAKWSKTTYHAVWSIVEQLFDMFCRHLSRKTRLLVIFGDYDVEMATETSYRCVYDSHDTSKNGKHRHTQCGAQLDSRWSCLDCFYDEKVAFSVIFGEYDVRMAAEMLACCVYDSHDTSKDGD